MNNLYEALQVCLESIEDGADIETSLAPYPDIADELRPIIHASVIARDKAVYTPSVEVMRRNRAKLLQRAAELREAQVKSSAGRSWFTSVRRAAVALAILAIIFMSGTGLVRASSATLPGDNLYPVKRTWEDVTLLLTFDLQSRESLEVEHENERLKELHELIAIGRAAKVDFAGIVTEQNGNEWRVAGIRVIVSPQTDLPNGPIFVGDAVRVFGITQSDNSVLVERIEQLPRGTSLPDIGDSGEGSNSGSNSGSDSSANQNDDSNVNNNDSSGPGNGNDNDNTNAAGGDNGGSNDTNSGSGSGNDNESISNSGPGGGTEDATDNSGSGSGNDNSDAENSGSGSGNDNSSEDHSGSGSGSDSSSDENTNSGESGSGGD